MTSPGNPSTDEPPPVSEGLAQLPHLTERELQVLLVAVESRQRLPIGDHSETGRILWSLHTAISEAIHAAQLDARRRRETVGEAPPECRAKRWNGTPAYDGPHPWHFFTYGPNGIYTGSCSGR